MNKRFFIASLAAAALAQVSCTAQSPVQDNAGQPLPNNGAPVETRPPNTTYQPAFAGQTRIGSLTTATAFEGKIINTGLTRPWGIAALPDGRLLITEKSGVMRIATPQGQLSATPIQGLPAVDARGQGGLLGLAVDPEFTSNRMVYWVFSEPVQGGNLTAVAKGRLADHEQSMEGATVIYRAAPAYNGDKHFGGRIVIDASGNLIICTGERSDLVTRPQAQDPNSGLGKLIRITKEGKAAPGNPAISQQRPEFYSMGHRSPQGLAFHPTTGELWESEMGPRGGDEINRIQPGKNYGWPTIGYGLEYSGQKVGAGITQKEGLEQPVYYWDPVLSPSGMTFYSGNAIPEWQNNLFICGLNSKHIACIVLNNNKVVGEERLLAVENQRFRDITQGKDGALYAVTDEGRLYRIGTK